MTRNILSGILIFIKDIRPEYLSQIKKSEQNILALFLCLIVSALYIYWALQIHNNLFITSGYDYYIYLIDSFLHGHLNVHSPNTYDLSLYHNKWYLYWGPAPVLLILPFYLFSALQASDRIYTLIVGLMNVLIFYFTVKQFQRYFHLSLSFLSETFIVLSFAFASPNFFLSLNGGIYFTNQVIATTYLLLFYLCYFLFLNKERYIFFLLATVFFYLAALSRYTLVFNGLLFLHLFLHYKLSSKQIPLRIIWSFGSLTLFFTGLLGMYNYLRFGNFLEVGFRYQQGAPRYEAMLKNYKVFSLSFVWNNIYYYFINTVHLIPTNRPIVVDEEGNSVFSVYPALLLLPVLFYNRKYINKKRLLFLIIGGTITITGTLFLLLYFATGWKQFGIRYFSDVISLLFLLLIFILEYIPNHIKLIILAIGVFVNIYGVLAYFGK